MPFKFNPCNPCCQCDPMVTLEQICILPNSSVTPFVPLRGVYEDLLADLGRTTSHPFLGFAEVMGGTGFESSELNCRIYDANLLIVDWTEMFGATEEIRERNTTRLLAWLEGTGRRLLWFPVAVQRDVPIPFLARLGVDVQVHRANGYSSWNNQAVIPWANTTTCVERVDANWFEDVAGYPFEHWIPNTGRSIAWGCITYAAIDLQECPITQQQIDDLLNLVDKTYQWCVTSTRVTATITCDAAQFLFSFGNFFQFPVTNYPAGTSPYDTIMEWQSANYNQQHYLTAGLGLYTYSISNTFTSPAEYLAFPTGQEQFWSIEHPPCHIDGERITEIISQGNTGAVVARAITNQTLRCGPDDRLHPGDVYFDIYTEPYSNIFGGGTFAQFALACGPPVGVPVAPHDGDITGVAFNFVPDDSGVFVADQPVLMYANVGRSEIIIFGTFTCLAAPEDVKRRYTNGPIP
jgi:hypothetical protein